MPRNDGKRQCRAKSKRTGKRCRQWAIHGATVCRMHGAGAGQVKRKAAERQQTEQASKALIALGRPRAIDPHVALLEEVYRTAGYIQTLALIVEDLDRERLVGGVTKTVQDPDGGRTVTVEAAYSVWYRLLMDERRHWLRACETAVRCGVEQARVELEQRQGALIADIFAHVFSDPTLGLSAEQRRTALAGAARHLRVLDGGRQAG